MIMLILVKYHSTQSYAMIFHDISRIIMLESYIHAVTVVTMCIYHIYKIIVVCLSIRQ